MPQNEVSSAWNPSIVNWRIWDLLAKFARIQGVCLCHSIKINCLQLKCSTPLPPKGNICVMSLPHWPNASCSYRHCYGLLNLYVHIVQVTEKTDFNKLVDKEPWLSSTRLVVKPDMLFGKRGKSGLVSSWS